MWVILALAFTFLLALFLRSYWNLDAAYQNGQFVLSGGSDPYYHKHAVDYILGLDTADGEARWQHLLFDPLLNYPYGMVNPNPPLYQWSVALGAAAVSPFADSMAEAAWWSTIWSSVIIGSALVFPLYLLGKELFSRKAGLIAAFLWAVSTGAMSNTSLGFADHDAMALFFIVLGFYFFIRSVKLLQGDRIWVEDWRSGSSIGGGIRALFRERSHAFAMATLAGVSFAAVALTWKGFPYALGIVLAFVLLSFMIDHWRNRDSTGLFLAALIAFVVALVLAMPYYYNPVVGVASFFNPILYLLVALLVAGLVVVPTRDLPTILVFPALIIAATLLAVIAFFVSGGAIAKSLLFTLVYFQQTTLYQTIAEAQRADFNSVVFAAGPAIFLLSLVAIGALLWRARKETRRDRLFMVVWALAAIYMAFSAARFLFNAVPVFILLGSWLVAKFIEWLDFGAVRRSMAASQGMRRSIGTWHIVGAILLALVLVFPSLWLAVDAGIPRSKELEYSGNGCIGEDGQLSDSFWCTRFGAYGQDYVGSQWVNGFAYLDSLNDYPAGSSNPADRPAFLSWWDYGHWAIAMSNHPAVADNFQNGYRVAGNWLLASNETASLQVIAGQYATLYERGGRADNPLDKADYLAVLRNVGVQNPEAVFDHLKGVRQDLPGGYKATPALNQTQTLDLIAALEADSGYRVRYFGVDGRMMPYDIPYDLGGQYFAQYAGLEDGGNILNAPIVLTNRNTSDFVDIKYRVALLDSLGQPTGQALELTGPQLEQRRQEKTFRGQPEAAKYEFDRGFFDSMFYRGFVGTPPTAVQSVGGDVVIDAMNYARAAGAAKQSGAYVPHGPGATLNHYRLIFAQGDGFQREIQDALRILEFYRGAVVQGQVVDEDGSPISGATVVAFDDAGQMLYNLLPESERVLELNNGGTVELTPADLNVGHATTTTGSDGRFTIRVPFSTTDAGVTVAAYRTAGGSSVRIGSESFPVTREQANDRTDTPVRTDVSIRVQPVTVNGTVFYDADQDRVYNATKGDALLEGATFTVRGRELTAGAGGNYTATLSPGLHPVTLTGVGTGRNLADYRLADGNLTVTPQGAREDIPVWLRPVSFNGTVVAMNGTEEVDVPAATTLSFSSTGGAGNTARATFRQTTGNGTYAVDLVPGTYNVTASFGGSTYTMSNFVVPRASEADAEVRATRLVLERRA
ncbi:MAG TPA: STT3 domain-containing protein [Candidatus Thermoplasmatota archaeon]|nr:STT3 domain-containing protein [Candidatus Thermoplasmatota archaeon]